jgi:hypothetical protein
MNDACAVCVVLRVSALSGDMYASGYHHITNLDFSSVVIDAMRAKYDALFPGSTMKWVVGDMTRLDNFAAGSFDVVIDKCAMDALLVDEGSPW